MIIGVIGDRGSGKTLFMTREAFNQYRRKRIIWSNYKLSFPKITGLHKPKIIPDEFFTNFEKFNMSNVCMFLDEIYIYIDSRSSASNKNKIMSYFFNQTRKTKVDLYYSTQFFSQVDKRLRFNTERFILPKAIKIPDETTKENILYILIEICNRDLKLLGKWIFKAEPVYNLYDTDEIVKFKFS